MISFTLKPLILECENGWNRRNREREDGWEGSRWEGRGRKVGWFFLGLVFFKYTMDSDSVSRFSDLMFIGRTFQGNSGCACLFERIDPHGILG